MVSRILVFLIVSLCAVVSLSCTSLADERASTNAQKAEFQKDIQPFLSSYCLKCHGTKEQKGERRFDELDGLIPDDDTFVDMQDILDLLNLGEMPPEDEKQPSANERRKVVAWLTASIKQYHQTRSPVASETILRRMNSREYENTIADMLELDVSMFRPARAFPQDQTTEHLDNIGSTLVTSGYLLSRYLDAADKVVNRGLFPLQQPRIRKWTFRDNLHQQPEIDQVHRKTNGFAYLTLYDVKGADKPEGAYAPIHAFKEGVPLDGFYKIRFKAKALNRENPYDPTFLGMDPEEPLRLGIVAGNYRVGDLHKKQPIEPLLAEIDLEDGESDHIVRVWLARGYTPRFTFQNGLMDARNIWGRLISKYRDQFPEGISRGIVAARYNAIKHGKLPQIHVDDIEIEGPFYDQWPRRSQQVLLGKGYAEILKTQSMSHEQMRDGITSFASRAYRRPVSDDEIERVVKVIEIRMAAGKNSIAAYADGLKSVLCSPNFLYLNDGNDNLNQHALATRMAYFLWSSTPDAELLDLASNGKLKGNILEQQVERMLNDSKSNRLVHDFLDSWLTLRDLGSTPPDRDAFRSYYHYDLQPAMLQETQLFTRHLLDENLSVVNFLDSDFTFVNKRLAAHYRLKPSKKNEFEKVALTDKRRGGLLGQASVLTVSANGIDTSPVVRGVWMLENVLGTPPSPPPPDVEPLDPDVRGAKTIREQLAKHRSVASCNDCHRKIDPLGFALENFDPIGRWRDSYGRNTKIDAGGKLPSGESFNNVVELKRVLLKRKDVFIRGLASKLMAYSLGRQLTPTDRPHIDKITSALSERGNGLRDLVKLTVRSELFQSP